MTDGQWWATFHHVPVKEGDAVYFQPGESVVDAEHDSESGYVHLLVMCAHAGRPDGGTPA